MSGAAHTWATDVAMARGMSGTVRAIFRELAYFADEDWYAYPNHQTLADVVGFNKKTVERTLKHLEVEWKLIESMDEGDRRCTGHRYRDGSWCTPGHAKPKGYQLAVQVGNAYIEEGVAEGRWVRSGRDLGTIRPRKTPGQRQGDSPSPWSAEETKPQVRGKGILRPPGLDEGEQGDSLSEQGDSQSLLARDLTDRAPVFEIPLDKDSSSSSWSGESRTHEAESQRRSEEQSEEQSSSNGSGDGGSLASGGDHRPPPPSTEVGVHRHRLGEVNIAEVQRILTAVTGSSVEAGEACGLVDRILGRASEQHLMSPTGYVLSAIRKSPSRTVEDLAALTEELAPAAPRSAAGGARSASSPAGSSRPVDCPIPEHSRNGYRKSNCPQCRLFGDFPASVTRSVYDRLDPAVQDTIRDRGVRVEENSETGEPAEGVRETSHAQHR